MLVAPRQDCSVRGRTADEAACMNLLFSWRQALLCWSPIQVVEIGRVIKLADGWISSTGSVDTIQDGSHFGGIVRLSGTQRTSDTSLVQVQATCRFRAHHSFPAKAVAIWIPQ